MPKLLCVKTWQEQYRIESSRVSRLQPDSLESEELNWQLQNNSKKGIRRCKEYFKCGLK
jgi:hypothetical protein